MNEAIAFDTHRFVKRLTENGFTEKQAEVLAEEQVNLLNSHLATKQDILSLEGKLAQDILSLEGKLEQNILSLEGKLEQNILSLEGKLEQDMTSLEGRLKVELANVKSDLLKWMIGALIAQGGLVVALVTLL